MINNLIHCSECNQVIPNYQGYDLTPASSLPGVEWSEADLVGAREFLRTHSGHKLEEFLVEEDSWVSEKPSHEPSRVSYCFAGNAGKRVLVRRTKATLDRPAAYEILPGNLKISNISITIQEKDLRTQIAAEKWLSPLLKGRMERFIQVFRGEIAKISPDKVEEEIAEIYDEEGATRVYARLKDSRWKRILSRCRLYFDKEELKALGRFIQENCNPPDVLSVQIERRISIIPLAGEKSVEDLQEREEAEKETEAPSVAVFKKGS